MIKDFFFFEQATTYVIINRIHLKKIIIRCAQTDLKPGC